jgi:surface antigen
MAAKRTTLAAALVLALGPGLSACLGFGDSGEDETPPPETTLLPNETQRRPSQLYGGTANTWQGGAAAAAAAKAPKGPLDKSPVSFPAPRTDLPALPTAGGPPAAGAAPAASGAMPQLPGAIPQAPASMAAAPAAAAAPIPAAAPQRPRPAPLPAGINAAAEGASILDVFRRDKIAPLVSRADDLYAERSAQLAMEYSQDGAVRGWTNPESGTAGTIRPTRTFQQADGGYCREYALSIEVRLKPGAEPKGAAEAGGRYACRLANGRWKFLP